mmetsp:Transcript_56040/g.137446  ORF Transcript_56040/g.137446 Transcript_56040/m.137446 type:complete len:204 (-) Transcript_56040:684-1295(-)
MAMAAATPSCVGVSPMPPRNCTMVVRPCACARSAGVQPERDRAETSTPRSWSAEMLSVLPATAALWLGRSPLRSSATRRSVQWHSTRKRITPLWPLRAARCAAFSPFTLTVRRLSRWPFSCSARSASTLPTWAASSAGVRPRASLVEKVSRACLSSTLSASRRPLAAARCAGVCPSGSMRNRRSSHLSLTSILSTAAWFLLAA